MRIGVVCPYSLSVFGGVQDQVIGLSSAMRRLGHDVRVLAPCDGAPPFPGVTPLGASIPTPSNGSVAPIAPDISCVLRTIRALWDEDFDVLHLHEPVAPGPTQTALTLKPAPMVGTFHRSGSTWLYGAPGMRWGANRLSVRVAVSPQAAAQARRTLGGEYLVLWNAVDVGRIRAAESRAAEGPTIMFLGREEPRKGLAVLLEAFATLPPEVRLWVAGPGTDHSALRGQYAGDDRISWLGEIDSAEKWARLRGADAICAPSLEGESFGIVLIEGMAAGTPVVASNIPGYRNVATSGDEVALFPPGDVAELAKRLQEVLFTPELAARLVEAGERTAERFSMGRLAERYLELFEPLLNGRRRRVVSTDRA